MVSAWFKQRKIEFSWAVCLHQSKQHQFSVKRMKTLLIFILSFIMVRTWSSLNVIRLFVFHLFHVAFTLTLTNDFQPIRVDDMDILKFSENIGQLDLMSCFMECVRKEEDCLAVYRSLSGECLIVKSTGTVLPEKVDAPSSQLWLRPSTINQNCSDAEFPISRGRSRYRLQATIKNWMQAKSDCESISSKLLELCSSDERAFIARVIKENPKATDYVHVGLKQRPGSVEPDQGWEWYWSKEAMSHDWDVSFRQPNNDGEQNVGAIRKQSGFLHDIGLSTHFVTSICECMLI